MDTHYILDFQIRQTLNLSVFETFGIDEKTNL